MFKHQSRGTDQPFVETKLGIVTRKGEWFFTTSEKIGEYVPGLYEEVSLEELILEAQAWVRSTAGLSITLLMGLLFLVHPAMALAGAVIFHGLWHTFKSAFVVRNMKTVLKVVNSDGYQMVISLVVLSALANQGQFLALGVGLLFFFITRLRLLEWVWRKAGIGGSGELTLNDRVLRMVIIRHAIYENLAPADVQQMEEKLKRMAFTGKKNDNSGKS